jgi:hypothetical protein
LRELIVLSLLLLAAALAWPQQAQANGVPIRIPLTYLSGLSNWGPAEARGEVELSFSESVIRLEASGLPALSAEAYQLWLAKSGTNKAVAVGTFDSVGGVAGYTGKLNGLDGYDYDLVLVSVEGVPDTDPAPSTRRSIGGFFTPIKRQDQAGGISADTQPAALPKTGDPLTAAAGIERHALALTLIAAGAGLMFVTARRARSRS